MENILDLQHITKTFPGVKALDDVQFEMRSGEVHALLGENGAGKSTLIKIVSGVYKPDSGEIRLDGKPVSFENPREAQAHGIATIYQELSLYPELTVAENIFMGHAPRNAFGMIDWGMMRRKAEEILASLNIFDMSVTRKVGTMTVGNRQRVEIAKALSLNARILIMDEPTASLTEADVERLFSIVRLLRERGVGIITSTFTTPNQARWIAEMWAYTNKCYPNLTWLETVESQEDQNLAFQQATTLINKYGEQLDGLFGMTSVATPGSSDAVTQAGLCQGTADEASAVHVVGLSTPNQMKPFVLSGCVNSVVLWNPIDLGYAAVYVTRRVVDGEFGPGDTEVDAGRLGTLPVVNGSEILLGPPFIYTADNIEDFDF